MKLPSLKKPLIAGLVLLIGGQIIKLMGPITSFFGALFKIFYRPEAEITSDIRRSFFIQDFGDIVSLSGIGLLVFAFIIYVLRKREIERMDSED